MQGHPLRWPLLGAAFIAGLDQVIKAVVLVTEPQVSVIPGFFAIRLATNTGVAFSLFQGFPRLVTLIGVLVLAGLMTYLWQRAGRGSRPERAALALLIGGAVGNLIDRLRFGYVVDFLDVYVGTYHWPTFNLADSAVSIGAVSLLIIGLLTPSSPSPAATPPASIGLRNS
jgi:signal peptidase II